MYGEALEATSEVAFRERVERGGWGGNERSRARKEGPKKNRKPLSLVSKFVHPPFFFCLFKKSFIYHFHLYFISNSRKPHA